MTKKIRKPAAARNTRKALPAPKSNGTTPDTVQQIASTPKGAVVLKVGALGATECASLTAAQCAYVLAREMSGVGSSDFPSGAVYQDGTQVARISYNGRAWDMSDRPIADSPSDKQLAHLSAIIASSDIEQLAQARSSTPLDPPPAQDVEPIAPTVDEQAVAEQLEPATSITVPASLLAAALAIAPKSEPSRPYLAGLYLHQTGDGDVRMVATDGHRMLVLNVPAVGEGARHEAHKWGAEGVILPGDAMTRIARYIGKDENAGVTISYGVGHPHVGVTEVNGMARFAVSPIGGRYPEYQKVVADAADAFTTSREPTETNAVDASYLKSAGAVAAALGAPHVFPFVGADGKCTVFTFATVPGAILYIMPVRQNSTSAGLQAETVRLIGAAGMAGTIAALKAHETRTRTAANNQRLSKEDRAKLTEKADAYKRRIEEIQAACLPALPAPAPAGADVGTGDDDSEGVNA